MKNSNRQMDKPIKNDKEMTTTNNIRSPSVSQIPSQTLSSKATGCPPVTDPEVENAESHDEPAISPDPVATKELSTRPAGGAYQISETCSLISDVGGCKGGNNTRTRDKKPADSQDSMKSKDVKKVTTSEGAVIVDKTELLSIPQTNFAIGLLVMCCFNPPFGLLALYFSLTAAAAYRDGDKVRGARCARSSIVISLLGIMLTMVVISSVVLYIAVNKHSARRGQRRMNSASLGF